MRKILWLSGLLLITASVIRLSQAVVLHWNPWPGLALFLLGASALLTSCRENTP